MAADPWLLSALGLGALLLLAIALLSAMETAILNSRRSRLAHLPGESKEIEAAEALLESPEQFQSSAHLAKSLAESLLYADAAFIGLEMALLSHREPIPDTLGELLGRSWPGVLAGALVAYFCVTLLGEIFPKTLASRDPERSLLRYCRAVRGFTLLFTPVWWVTSRLGRALVKTARADGQALSRAAHSEEEIKLLVEGSAEEGVLEEEEKEMIHSIIEFTDTIARQIMVPRIDVHSVSVGAPLSEVVEEILTSGHSRLPVYEGTLDNVVGIIHSKSLLSALTRGEAAPLRDLLREPYFIPEGKKLDELLQEFRKQKVQIAIVVDEFGGTSGIVTVEDVLEEIVGEIEDEYDEAEPEQVEDIAGGDVIVDGRMPVADVNEELCLEIPPGDYDTLGGFVFSLFGRPPEVGEQVSYGTTHFLVDEMEGLRIGRIRVVREHSVPELAGEASLDR